LTHVPGPYREIGSAIYANSPQPVDPTMFRGFTEPEGDRGYLIAESIPHDGTRRLLTASPEVLDALEQLLIGIGMGWDLDGLVEQAINAAKKAGSEIFP
jgi:hypothetical protein